MHCVIGSGPAGIACAHALLERGLTVQMIDAGIELERWRAQRLVTVRATDPETWSSQDLAWMKELESGADGVPLKRLYGSSFPYDDADTELNIARSAVGVRASLARGGFSNVWGAAMLPYIDEDLGDWPIGVAHLSEHYRAITGITGISAVEDDLAETFPIYAEHPAALALSCQARRFLDTLRRHRQRLCDSGIHFGQARLAITTAGHSHDSGCVYCGMCLYGCPRELIYNSAATVAKLSESAHFSYRPNFIVDAVTESANFAVVQGRDRLTAEPAEISCSRVYLAAGAISTTSILLRSMAVFDRAIYMRDSQYFLVPLLMRDGVRDVRKERLHTLSQLFIELRDPALSPYTVHLQAYTYNDLISKQVRDALGGFAGLLDRLARIVEGRLIILQGYLHSAHSGRIRVELQTATTGAAPTLHVVGETQPETRRVVRRVLFKLARHARPLGAIPLMPLVKIAEPGRGFHTGGTFPMRDRPHDFECDVLGRPAGWSRVHAVDATVLPSIPATTITFTVMANAHRIGWESALL